MSLCKRFLRFLELFFFSHTLSKKLIGIKLNSESQDPHRTSYILVFILVTNFWNWRLVSDILYFSTPQIWNFKYRPYFVYVYFFSYFFFLCNFTLEFWNFSQVVPVGYNRSNCHSVTGSICQYTIAILRLFLAIELICNSPFLLEKLRCIYLHEYWISLIICFYQKLIDSRI